MYSQALLLVKGACEDSVCMTIVFFSVFEEFGVCEDLICIESLTLVYIMVCFSCIPGNCCLYKLYGRILALKNFDFHVN